MMCLLAPRGTTRFRAVAATTASTAATAAGYDLTHDFLAGFGNDTVTGSSLADVIYGGDGDDLLGPGFGGTDWLYGGAGNDTATFLVAVQAVTADLVAGTATRGAAVANLFSIENLTGSTLDDVLRGNGLDNRLKGEDGNDILVGRGGNDLLIGGAGNDKFIFASGSG